MLSAIQKTISDALSSVTSTREPQVLKRPPSNISSPPHDPAASPTAAHMPQPQSGTSSTKGTRRKEGRKATEYLRKHLGAEEIEDDLIVTSSPPEQRGPRIKSGTHPTGDKRQDLSPTSIRQREPVQNPELTHQHLLVDPDERSLFPGIARQDSAAVLIPIPGSTRPKPKSSAPAMRTASSLRPVNTLDDARNRPISNGARNCLEVGHGRPSRSAASNPHMFVSKTVSPTRNGTEEPPAKRQRVEQSTKPYVRNEGAGLVSPTFSSRANEDRIVTASRTSKTPVAKQARSSKSSDPLPFAVGEYQSVEANMHSSRFKSNSQKHFSLHLAAKLSNGHRQRSEESDPESFARASKRARYQQHFDESAEFPLNSPQAPPEPDEVQNSRKTPPSIQDVFTAAMLPSDEGLPRHEAGERPEGFSTTGSVPARIHGHPTRGVRKRSDIDAVQTGGNPSRTAGNSHSGKEFKVRPKGPILGASTFRLRYLKYGILPGKESYVAKVSDDLLELYDTESTLSPDPIWTPIRLRKILKVHHGSDDCLKVILETSHCQGEPFTKIHIELNSSVDKEKFVSLMPDIAHRTPKGKKNDEYLRKCFEREPEANRGTYPERLPDVLNQPISNQWQVPGTTSPHFQDPHTLSANNISRRPKLTSQLQQSSSISRSSGAGSRIPSTITGKERASQTLATSTQEAPAGAEKKNTSDQARCPKTSRLRSSSGKIPATRSSLKAEMSINESEDEAPRKKCSEVHSFGKPWKTPLIYPQTGKRRMAVEFGDLFRLDEDEFLNDNLIGFFLRYLEYHLEQTHPELAEKVYFYNSYFFERLTHTSKGKKGINYESVQKWTRNIDIFNHDFVVVPVNESFHWYVVIICNLSKLSTFAENQGEELQERSTSEMPAVALEEGQDEAREGLVTEESHDQPTEKTTESLSHLSLSDQDEQLDQLGSSTKAVSSLSSPRPGSTPRKLEPARRKGARNPLPKYNVSASVIMTFDSLGVARSSTCTALRQYIVEEAKTKKGWEIDGSQIKGMTARGIPTQPNFSDCGLYLCAYLEKFILNPADFVGRILQRQMDPGIDMPMMASGELRSRMRALIMELHKQQEGEESEFPMPDIGRILLAQQEAVSPGGISAPRTPLQDESEDELQRDHTDINVRHIENSRRVEAPALMTERTSNPLASTERPPEESAPSKASNLMLDMLDKINAEASWTSKSTSGTKETAITIDDDEDPQPVPKSVPAKKIPIAKDDFFGDPSELKDIAGVDKTSPPRRTPPETSMAQRSAPHRKTGEESKDTHLRQRRSDSRESADTVDTDYLSGTGNKSYQHNQREHDARPQTSAKNERRPLQEIVLLVPDSQESVEEAEDDDRGVGSAGVREQEREGQQHKQGEIDEPQEILEGVE